MCADAVRVAELFAGVGGFRLAHVHGGDRAEGVADEAIIDALERRDIEASQRIVDEDDSPVTNGTMGEILVRGPQVMKGYWNLPDETAETLRGGWMHTGDLAVIDEQGYGRIVGRAKDMIIRGGENIYPREIEEYLYRHEAVEDVQVVGVADEKFGEEICACIRPRNGSALTAHQVIEFCRGQIAHYKVPRYVRFFDSFPMTVTGKVQKHLLRDIVAQDLAETDAPTTYESRRV